MRLAGYPLHRENRENGQKEFPVRSNTGKTQGIRFAQVVDYLIPKVKDISILPVKSSKFLLKLDKTA